MAAIRVGIGGWVFAPWRGVFYPEGLPQARELHYASRALTSIEINGTFYGAQKPASFRKWHAETPPDFVFSVKGTRYATHRRDLRESRASVERFFGTGVLELGEKLGPILWQFPATTRFDAANFAAFLEILPQEIERRRIRHVLEVQHPSFKTEEFTELLRAYKVAAALVDSEKHPLLEEATADFVYARLRRTVPNEATGYSPSVLDAWAGRFRQCAGGADGRDCFVYFISGAKERAPAAAQALIERVGTP
jgi:uncharacterized protein YecE (DUF72 family)